jgi:RNA polymerase sigma factor (TIGR02999 family)
LPDTDPEHHGEIQALLEAIEQGDSAALEQLVQIIYPELKRLAHFQLASERPGHTLNTTAIVHEAYLRLASGQARWSDRAHFLRAAATVMRHLLVDSARKYRSNKRGDGIPPLSLDDCSVSVADESMAVLALDDALKNIARIDPRLEQLIECRYFAGLSVEDTAAVMAVSPRTVEREWQRARAYLLRAMQVD